MNNIVLREIVKKSGTNTTKYPMVYLQTATGSGIIEIQVFLVKPRMNYRDMWIGRLVKREISRF